MRFKKQYSIQYQAPTNKAKVLLQHYTIDINNFHVFLRYIATQSIDMLPLAIDCIVGIYKLCNIANIDQIPLPFDFLSGKTYSISGAKTVWIKVTESGLDKH